MIVYASYVLSPTYSGCPDRTEQEQDRAGTGTGTATETRTQTASQPARQACIHGCMRAYTHVLL